MVKNRAAGRFAMLLFIFLSFPAGRGVSAQSTKPFSLRVDVELVPVEVVALDKNGKPVKNLKKENFRLYEDGKRQEILSFDEVTETQGNNTLLSMDNSGRSKGKTVLILFDDSALSAESIHQARDSAAFFVKEHMKPQDLFAVASFSNDLKILQNFTRDPAKISKAIAQPVASISNYSHPFEAGAGNQIIIQSENLLRALQGINYSIERLKGKKSVLIFSESNYLDTKTDEMTYKAALISAKRSNVVYCTVDPGGLKSVATEAPPPQWSPAGSTATIRPANIDHSQGGGSAMSLLKALASETGGSAIFNMNNFKSALDDLGGQLSHYYILGFSSNNPKRNGDLRKLEAATDLKGIVLKHRQAYVDRRPVDMLASSKNEGKLLETLASPEPAGRLPVVFRSACFYDSPLPRVFVFAEIGMEKASVKKKGDKLESDLSIMGAAYAEDGSIAGRFSETLHTKLEKEQDIHKMNLPYRNYFKLQPGKYRLKLAVTDGSSNLGSAEQSFEVTAKPKQGLAVNSLVVVAQKSALPNLVQDVQAQMLDDSDPLVHNGMQITPSVRHRLPAGAAIYVLFKIYNINGVSNQWKLQVKAKLVGEKGEEFIQPSIDLSETKLVATGSSEATAGLDLAFPGAKPGKYILFIETSEAGFGEVAASQTDIELTGN
jgi:VWFA-related protein